MELLCFANFWLAKLPKQWQRIRRKRAFKEWFDGPKVEEWENRTTIFQEHCLYLAKEEEEEEEKFYCFPFGR